MARKNDCTVNFTELLLNCLGQSDPMLHMLKWLCDKLMEAELSQTIRAEKSERTAERETYRCGYRPRRLDTRMGTMYLLVPKVRQGGYIPFFVTERKRSEAALIQVVQEAFINGVSTRKIEKLANSLGISGISKSQVSEMTKGLNDQVSEFRNRKITTGYPILWVDALYEKVRVNGKVESMAVMVVCGVDEQGKRTVLAVEPMFEESESAYAFLFRELQERGLMKPKLVISDAHKGLVAAIGSCFAGTKWQRCKVHFMRNILANVSHREKANFADRLKDIWLAQSKKLAMQRAEILIKEYANKFPKAIKCLEEGLEDSLIFYDFEEIDHRKISSTNMLERLNKEIRRRTRVIGIFPNLESYIRLVTTYLIEYSEDWSSSRAYIQESSMQEIVKIAA